MKRKWQTSKKSIAHKGRSENGVEVRRIEQIGVRLLAASQLSNTVMSAKPFGLTVDQAILLLNVLDKADVNRLEVV